MAMRPRRDEILEQFRACEAKLGRTPGQDAFCRMAGIRASDFLYYWPRFTDLQREAGSAVNVKATLIPEDALFAEYAKVCLHLGRVPTYQELRIATRELGTRTHTVSARFGGLDAFRDRFRRWLESQENEFKEILAFDGWNPQSVARSPNKKQKTDSPVVSFHPFLPGVLQYLDVLARGERAPYTDPTKPVSSLFEVRCADAFRCWGFEVMDLGQGRGRRADCLALARQERFGIIIDAKARIGEYVLGTEDRKFYEYAKEHTAELVHQGIEKTYLVVVGPSFRQQDLSKLTTFLADSPVRGVAMITATALMRHVEGSIRERHRYRTSQVEQLLFGNKIID